MYNVSDGTTDRGRIDRFTAGLYLVFLFLGWLSVYAASYDLENAKSIFDLSGRAGMQLIWIGTSLVLAFALMKSDTGFFETYAFVFYAFGIVLLIITLAIAPEIKGSRSWLVLGPVRLQPAEFMKFVIALALARVFNTYGFRLLERKNLLLVLAIILLPTALVIAQSETGTALVYLSLFLVLFREGMPDAVLLIGVALVLYFVLGIKFSDIPMGSLSRGEFISILLIILFSAGMVWSYMKRKEVLSFMLGIPFVVFLIALTAGLFGIEIDYGLVALIALCGVFLYILYLALRFRKRTYLLILIFMAGSFAFLESAEYMFNDVLKPHQQMRIKVTLGMERDLQGAGYHVEQSKIAIGSGGLWGKGFLNGTQTKLKYVPEQDTDFIFCTIGEEMGFVGSSIILLLYLIFILRLIYLAERQTSVFGRVYGYGVASIFIFHVMVNIGMVVGILPVIGIPLPFFSYGGSSLWGFTILLFIFLRIDKARRI
ncbi:rod shape-determining protein RodA [Dysgonamonadaceae bacterium]|nr:rod shape-determining protein RodA [Dysgonamonadaceae bacterium]